MSFSSFLRYFSHRLTAEILADKDVGFTQIMKKDVLSLKTDGEKTCILTKQKNDVVKSNYIVF